ncbi:MAG: phosphoenolpyruvate carboxykinase (ATP) [Clostridiales bacterium]|nr:phosphoenolpyruvate carboxykinase (ATP) [Clostridiales bacterium]
MSTKQNYKWSEVQLKSPYFSPIRSTIETAFYGNNVVPVRTVAEAYHLACHSPGTVVLDQTVHRAEEIGLPADAKVLLFNDGDVKGRAAAARRILGEPGIDLEEYSSKIREAVYNTRFKKLYHAQAYAGLDKEFMVKLHLLIPEHEENIMYSWMLNFQYITEEYYNMYKDSRVIENEGDIYIFSDPTWSHPDHPMGLAFFDPAHNCAAILGMRYFGEHKKGTLTLAWGIANRHGYAACHGGLKRYNLNNGRKFVAGVFGLSGSGKSTITHARHEGKYDITVLHDDAFVLSVDTGAAVALEPAYFDKTQDYPLGSPDNAYLITIQNNGVTLDENGDKVLVMEDIRNGNGRAMKSRMWSPNRVDRFDEPANAIIWLMKDPTLPPVLRITDPVLAATLGATLATKRTSAERLAPGVDPDALVVEPYANPFRTYPLANDYAAFKALFDHGVECYIFNTGFFMKKKVTKEATLGSLEKIVEGTAHFTSMGLEGIELLAIEGFKPDFTDAEYKRQFIARLKDRVGFISAKAVERGGYDKLPDEALAAMNEVVEQAGKL